jgi:hypothetical protein
MMKDHKEFYMDSLLSSVLVQIISDVLTVSGGAAWIAATLGPKLTPLLRGAIDVCGGNIGFAKNKNVD